MYLKLSVKYSEVGYIAVQGLLLYGLSLEDCEGEFNGVERV